MFDLRSNIHLGIIIPTSSSTYWNSDCNSHLKSRIKTLLLKKPFCKKCCANHGFHHIGQGFISECVDGWFLLHFFKIANGIETGRPPESSDERLGADKL